MRTLRIASLLTLIMLAAHAALASPQAGTYSGHGAETVPPEVLAQYAPPPLPADLSRKIQSVMDIRAPGLGIVSPDGSRLYFTWSVTGTIQIWRLDGPDRFPVQLTGGEDRTTLAGISPDGRTLFVQRDRSGEENPGLYTMPAEGGPLTAIQHLKGVQTFFFFSSDDGRWLYYGANDLRPDSYAVYRYDLETGAKEALVTEPGLWQIADHTPAGRLLLAKYTGSLSAEYSEWNPETRALTPLLGQGEKEEYIVRYGASPGQFLVLTPKFGEFRRLYRLEGGRFEPVTPELTWDVSGFDIDPKRTRILFSVNEGGYTRLHGLNAKTFEALGLPEFPGADHVYYGETSWDGRYTALGIETATSPRTNWVLDWKTGALSRWVVPSAPEVDTRTFSVATLEHYPARDGTKIPMFVRRPKAASQGPCPVVVEFHGGPESQATPGFSPMAQLYVDAGFTYVEPNVRGSDGYGKTWLASDDGPKRLQVITDIEDCARFIRENWAVAGKAPRVGVIGGSYGGYAVLMAMTRFAGAYDAGCSTVGISNLLTFLNNTAPYRRILRISEYGDPEKDKEALLQLSATTYVDRLQAPLLIIQGATDPRVPAGEALQMYEAARKKGVPSGLMIFPDEGHGAGKRNNRVLMYGHELLWMQKHLQEDPQ
ncbi:MAG: prolyl oligopeptidase family serine peptidase [Acidobacteriota bacterium]